MTLKQSQCANHADRYGHAICMSCRKTLCQECATEWDGIFHCAACLAARRTSSSAAGKGLGFVLVAGASAALFLLGPRVLVWGCTLLQRSVGN